MVFAGMFALMTACTSTINTNNDSSQSVSESIENNQSNQIDQSSSIPSDEVCQKVGAIYSNYSQEFDDFRYGPSDTPWQVFYDLSARASGNLVQVAQGIDAYGIDWDSKAIVSSLIYSSAQSIDDIKSYIENNQFPIGRDLETIFREIEMNLGSVIQSSCR
jgi:hypothetical protein